MITLTPQAQKLRDEYLRSIRDHFRGSKTVDGEEVARDIAEHIERELQEAAQPVSEADMAKVIDRLGDPRQWGSDDQVASHVHAATGHTYSAADYTHAAPEERPGRRFSAAPGGTLVVDIDFGSITVNGGKTTEVVVDVQCSDGSRTEQCEFLKKFPVHITQDGSTVMVKAKSKWFVTLLRRPVEAEFVISVPSQFNAQLETSGGSIRVRDLNGTTDADTSAGDLEFTRLSGRLKGDSSAGGIRVTDCIGEISLDSSGGGIEVVGGSGTLDSDSSGGPVRIKDFHGDIDADSSGGGVRVENATGRIKADSSGGGVWASLAVPLSEAVELSSSGGGITLCVPENAAFELNAETSGGDVTCELPVTTTGMIEYGYLKGTVNGGGKLVRLDSSGGSICVKKL